MRIKDIDASQGTFTLNPAVTQAGASLFLMQLNWGLKMQRYETTISPDEKHPAVNFFDPAGLKLARAIGDDFPFESLREYANAFVAHPLEFLSLYTRHFINGLDLRDGMVYATRASATRNGIALINFLVLALACWTVCLLRTRSAATSGDEASHKPAPQWPLWLCLWLLPVVMIIPGAVETRFFAPLHLLAYCTIAFLLRPRLCWTVPRGIGWPSPQRSSRGPACTSPSR